MKNNNYVSVAMCFLCGAIIIASTSGEHIEHLLHSQYNPPPVDDTQIVGTASLPSISPGTVNT